MTPYWYSYAYWFWRCRWFPWLPRWWWMGIYGPLTPHISLPAYARLPKEQELVILEGQRKILEEALSQINKRMEELKKEGSSSTEEN